MNATLRYLWLTLKHKAFVFRAGVWTRAPIWRLVIHDWSKFTPTEAPHYGRQFFGTADDPLGFACAWAHHQNLNPHHWEYWIPRTGHERGRYGDLLPLPMPWWAVREMVADWMGASRAYEGRWPPSVQEWPWFEKSWPRIAPRMHPTTIRRVESVIGDLFGFVLPESGELHPPCFACDGHNIARFDNGSPCYDLRCPVCEAAGRGSDNE